MKVKFHFIDIDYLLCFHKSKLFAKQGVMNTEPKWFEMLEEEDLVARSAAQGKILHEALAAVSHPSIREVRGKGLWIGVEVDPRQLAAKTLCIAMGQRGVLTKETHETVIRFAPPLTIETADILLAVDVFAAALNDCAPQTKVGRGAASGGSAM